LAYWLILHCSVLLRYRPDNTELPNGSLVFFVRLGGKPIEFDKDKSGIAVATAEKLPGVIDTLIAAVRNGELDTVLGQVKRPPMQKKKAA